MTRRVVVDGIEFAFDFEEQTMETSGLTKFTLVGIGGQTESVDLSVEQVATGIYSVLAGTQSHTVRIEETLNGLNVWVGDSMRSISLVDPRDRASIGDQGARSGPSEIRSQMPGKIIRLLVREGDDVEAGQGIIVVEAMKMQNEVKSPKSAHVKKIYVREGEAVIAGQALILVA